MNSILQAHELKVRLGGRMVVEGISFELHAGEVLAVLGENGSGKSTLIRSMAGILKPFAGQVTAGGDPVHSLRPRDRTRRIACSLQDAFLEFDFDVIDVVGMGVPQEALIGVRTGRARESLASLEIGHLAGRSWGALSGGERQRAHLARLFASRAPALLLDEPGNHLDLASRVLLRGLLHDRAELGAAVLFTTHDLEEAAWADTVVVLNQGRVEACGAPATVLTPDLIERVFRVSARLLPDPKGGPPAVRVASLDPGGEEPGHPTPCQPSRPPQPC